jgi:hypothetical protein
MTGLRQHSYPYAACPLAVRLRSPLWRGGVIMIHLVTAARVVPAAHEPPRRGVLEVARKPSTDRRHLRLQSSPPVDLHSPTVVAFHFCSTLHPPDLPLPASRNPPPPFRYLSASLPQLPVRQSDPGTLRNAAVPPLRSSICRRRSQSTPFVFAPLTRPLEQAFSAMKLTFKVLMSAALCVSPG